MVERLTEEQTRLVHDNVNLAHAAAKVRLSGRSSAESTCPTMKSTP